MLLRVPPPLAAVDSAEVQAAEQGEGQAAEPAGVPAEERALVSAPTRAVSLEQPRRSCRLQPGLVAAGLPPYCSCA